jgi:WD40 repeat protein
VVYVPRTSLVASGSSDRYILLWDVRDGRATARYYAGDTITCLTASPDGQFIVAGTIGSFQQTIQIWNIRSGELERKLEMMRGHNRATQCVAVSPDGKLLASGGDDAAVILWEFPAGKQRAVFKAHESVVREVCISPNGEVLASASYDGTIRLWTLPK